MSRSYTKPVKPAVKSEIKAAHMANHARCIEELQRIIPPPKINAKRTKRQIKPPLWVTLRIKVPEVLGDPLEWEVFSEYGHVVPRHNASGESGAPFSIGSLPTADAPLTVVVDTKLWVTLAIDESGLITDADFNSGTAWPTDSPPSLIGGDDQTGASGYRHVRIAEIIANPASTTIPPQLRCNQLHTGHIDHFQPELLENLTTSPSTGEARVMKEWNASDGRWDLRYLSAGAGITITENASSIGVAANVSFILGLAPHQWQAIKATNTTLDVRGGKVTSQPSFTETDVAAIAGMVVGASGYVILTVTRDELTREVTGIVMSYNAGALPDSDYTTQIIPLSYVTFGGGAITEILTIKTDEIHILEDLVVVNGEFRLADSLLASRKVYELPPP